jgi:hypothetical protein
LKEVAGIFRLMIGSGYFLGLCQEAWKKLEPYHPEELLPALLGLILVFYGGTFMTIIAAVEAYRIIGWANTEEALKVRSFPPQHHRPARIGLGMRFARRIGSLGTKEANLFMRVTEEKYLKMAVTEVQEAERGRHD